MHSLRQLGIVAIIKQLKESEVWWEELVGGLPPDLAEELGQILDPEHFTSYVLQHRHTSLLAYCSPDVRTINAALEFAPLSIIKQLLKWEVDVATIDLCYPVRMGQHELLALLMKKGARNLESAAVGAAYLEDTSLMHHYLGRVGEGQVKSHVAAVRLLYYNEMAKDIIPILPFNERDKVDLLIGKFHSSSAYERATMAVVYGKQDLFEQTVSQLDIYQLEVLIDFIGVYTSVEFCRYFFSCLHRRPGATHKGRQALFRLAAGCLDIDLINKYFDETRALHALKIAIVVQQIEGVKEDRLAVVRTLLEGADIDTLLIDDLIIVALISLRPLPYCVERDVPKEQENLVIIKQLLVHSNIFKGDVTERADPLTVLLPRLHSINGESIAIIKGELTRKRTIDSPTIILVGGWPELLTLMLPRLELDQGIISRLAKGYKKTRQLCLGELRRRKRQQGINRWRSS